MKFLMGSLLTTGVSMGQLQSVHAQDKRVTQGYLSEIVSQARARYNIPAIAVTVMNAKTVYLQEIQGLRVFDKPAQASLGDYFHLGSCAKSVLAVIAATLVHLDKVRWDTRFFDIFPELKTSADSAYAEITLEDLLLSRAGIRPYTLLAVDPIPDYGPEIQNKREAFIKHLVRQSPSSKKNNGGFQYLYSNASYTMASTMLERASGKTYEELISATLHDRMGFDAHIGWPNRIQSHQPWGHIIAGSKVEAFGPEHEYRLPELLTPAGDLSMTPKDYAEYTRLHLQGLRGNDNVISSAEYRHIHFARDGFALGVFNGRMLGKQYTGFDGSAGTFYCRSIIVSESDFAFTIMINAGSPSGSMDAVEWLSRKIVEKELNLSWWRKLWLRLWW